MSAHIQVFWTLSASYSEASLHRATFPLISLDRPASPQAFSSSVESMVVPDPLRSLCDSVVDVALGTVLLQLFVMGGEGTFSTFGKRQAC